MDEETTEFPWSRQPGEPERWYHMFHKYYIPLGPTRNLLRACIAWMLEEEPEKYKAFVDAGRTGAGTQWSTAARKYNWLERAREYDKATEDDLPKIVEAARQKLMSSAEMAAVALQEALKNPRLQVAAAKEILDRAGLPATSVVATKTVPYTADDLAAARREIQEWERTLKTGSEQSG